MRFARAAAIVTTALTACTLLTEVPDDATSGPAASTDHAVDAAPGAPTDCVASDSGLVAYFGFEEGAGPTTRDCVSGIVGQLGPAAGWGVGRTGFAMELDASFVALGNPSVLKITGAITVAAWIFVAADLAADERPAIVTKMGRDGARGWALEVRAGTNTSGHAAQFIVSREVDAGAQEELVIASGANVALGSWAHLAGSYEPGAHLRVYVDGRMEAERTDVPAVMNDPPVQATIGGRAYDYWHRGRIDDVRIYTRALSAAEIAALAAR